MTAPKTAPISTLPPSILTTAARRGAPSSPQSGSFAPTPRPPQSVLPRPASPSATPAEREQRSMPKPATRSSSAGVTSAAFEAEAASLYAQPMDTEQMRALRQHPARGRRRRHRRPPRGTAGTGQRNRQTVDVIARRSPRSQGPVGRPTTRSPNSATTSCPSAAHAPPATPAPPAHCAPSPPQRSTQITESPSVPNAANPVSAASANRGPASTSIRGVGRAPFFFPRAPCPPHYPPTLANRWPPTALAPSPGRCSGL